MRPSPSQVLKVVLAPSSRLRHRLRRYGDDLTQPTHEAGGCSTSALLAGAPLGSPARSSPEAAGWDMGNLLSLLLGPFFLDPTLWGRKSGRRAAFYQQGGPQKPVPPKMRQAVLAPAGRRAPRPMPPRPCSTHGKTPTPLLYAPAPVRFRPQAKGSVRLFGPVQEGAGRGQEALPRL